LWILTHIQGEILWEMTGWTCVINMWVITHADRCSADLSIGVKMGSGQWSCSSQWEWHSAISHSYCEIRWRLLVYHHQKWFTDQKSPMAVFCTMRMAFGHPYSHCEIGWRLLVYRHQWVPRPGMVVFFTKRMTFGHPYSHREVVWRLFWYSKVNNLQSMISWTYSFWCDLRGEVHYSNNIKALMFYNLVKHVKVSWHAPLFKERSMH